MLTHTQMHELAKALLDVVDKPEQCKLLADNYDPVIVVKAQVRYQHLYGREKIPLEIEYKKPAPEDQATALELIKEAHHAQV